MTTTTSDQLLAAVQDGTDLVTWVELNTIALNDERVEAAVFRGLGGPVPEELAHGVPLLKHANTDVPPMPLLDALIEELRHRARTCDLCRERIPSGMRDYRLVVPCASSVVAVHTCGLCHDVLNDVFACGLVWS